MGVTINVSGVDKVFSPAGGSDIGVLDRLSVTFAAGTITGIIGPSGSGKSTLLHIIGTLEPQLLEQSPTMVLLRQPGRRSSLRFVETISALCSSNIT